MHMDISHEPFYAENTGKMPDAPAATPVLREPARSKCTWTCHESQEDFNAEISRKMPDIPSSTPVLCKLAQSKCTWACHKGKMDISQVCTRATLYGNLRKNAGPQSRTRHFAQACVVECTWTFHKRHFVWRLKEKMPDPHPRHGIL